MSDRDDDKLGIIPMVCISRWKWWKSQKWPIQNAQRDRSSKKYPFWPNFCCFSSIFGYILQKRKKIAKMSTRQRWWWQTWIPMVCISRRNQSFLMQICVSNCSVIFHSWNKPSSLRAKGPRGLEIANRQLSIYHLQPLDNLCKKLDILALPCKKSESATINTQWGLNQFKIRWKLWMLFFA